MQGNITISLSLSLAKIELSWMSLRYFQHFICLVEYDASRCLVGAMLFLYTLLHSVLVEYICLNCPYRKRSRVRYKYYADFHVSYYSGQLTVGRRAS